MLRRRQDRHRRAAAHLDRALRALGVGTGAVAPAWRVRSDGGNSRLAGRRGSEPRRLGDRAGPRRGRADSPPPAQPAKPAQDYAGAGRLPGLRARIDDGLGRVRRRTGGPTARRHRTQCLQAGRAVALARGAHGRPRRARRVGRSRGRGSSGSSSATWLRAQRGWQPRRAAASRALYHIGAVALADRGVVFTRDASRPDTSLVVRRSFADARVSTVKIVNDPQPDLVPSSAGALYQAFGHGWYRWDFGQARPRRASFPANSAAQLLSYEHGRWFILTGDRTADLCRRRRKSTGPAVVYSGGQPSMRHVPG